MIQQSVQFDYESVDHEIQDEESEPSLKGFERLRDMALWVCAPTSHTARLTRLMAMRWYLDSSVSQAHLAHDAGVTRAALERVCRLFRERFAIPPRAHAIKTHGQGRRK